MALLIVLERMTPAERVVFVLHDVFEYPFETVAPMVGRTAAACRQLASRARRRIKEEAGAARFEPDLDEQRRVIDAFIAACAGGEIEELLPLLDPAAMGWADVGGTLPVVSRPTSGREQVARGAMQYFGPASGATLMAHDVNGEPGIIAFRAGDVFAVVALSVKNGAITRLYAVVDPRKLAHVKRMLRPQ
jgi:RNA polymerase sigma-70 factor (ECF subfamily)